MLFLMSLLCFRVHLFIVGLWSPAGKRAELLALVYNALLCVCYFLIGILGQVWYLIVSIPDLCPLSYFYIGLYGKLENILCLKPLGIAT